MTEPETPWHHEQRRLAALRGLGVLDTTAEEEFDSLVRAAALVCGVPISLVSLVDHDRQWFKARVGLAASETPRDVSFCAHAIHDAPLMEVADATQDPRFVANGLVTGEPGIRFYAGMPLTLSTGERVGTLCVIDRQPRSLDERQRAILVQLAAVAVKALERRRTAIDCSLSEMRFRALSSASPFPVFAADSNGRITYANARWQAMFGNSGEDWRERVVAEDRGRIDAAWQQSDHESTAPELLARVVLQDGSTRRIRVLWHEVVDDEGQPTGRTGVVEDVTERFESNALVTDLNARLATESERKNIFMATLAHELRGPLSAIVNGVTLLRLGTLPMDRIANVVNMVGRQAGVMKGQIDGLLDVAAISLGKVQLIRGTVNLNEVVSEAVETSLAVIETHQHELVLDLPTEPVELQGEFGRLVQIVGNLITNAAKYTPEGGRISLQCATGGRMATLVVSDNGVGIEPDRLEAIFGLYAQERQAWLSKASGLGIGLSLARNLAQLHGGSLIAESDGPGRGSRFVLSLPLGA